MRAPGVLATLVLLLAGVVRAELHVDAEVALFAYPKAASPRDPDATLWTRADVEWKSRLGAKSGSPWLVLGARAEGITSGERGPIAFDPADREPRRSPLALGDFFLRARAASGVDLTVGRFRLGWGKTDGYSPADAFLPRDLSDPFADEKLAMWGVRLNGQRGGTRFDLFAAGLTTPWRLPVLEGRFAPLAVDGVFLVDGRSDVPTPGFAAARAQHQWGEWDLGAWARGGVRPAPLLVFRPELRLVTADGIALPVDRRHVSEWGIGLELSKVAGGWMVRGEVGALFSADAELGDALLATVGIERRAMGGTLLVTVAANAINPPIAEPLLFDRALLPMLIAAWTRDESWGGVRLTATTGLRRGDCLLKAEIMDRLDDELALTAGVDIPVGDREGPLGVLANARRVRVALRWRR